ncbi:MAG TPA: hypothetical protein VF017_07720 [Thermoanaerobaculia bacterium]|nr:hypothetical protein [Thermoanaerobaculia bacterium]
MTEALLKDQLLEDLDRLPVYLQRRVRDFAHALVLTTPQGTPSEAPWPFFGVLDDRSADEMEQAIYEHCEQP